MGGNFFPPPVLPHEVGTATRMQGACVSGAPYFNSLLIANQFSPISWGF